MRYYFLKRLLLMIPTLFGVAVLIFFLLRVLPGDIVELKYAGTGVYAPKEAMDRERAQLGLDQPLYLRYLNWLGRLVRGDLGTSLANQREVAELISGRLANTMFLATVTALLAVPLAVSLGIVAAVYRDTWIDKTLSIATLSTISLPDFFVAYILITVFAVQLHAFPALSIISPGMSLAEKLYAITLPVLTLSLVVTAHMNGRG